MDQHLPATGKQRTVDCSCESLTATPKSVLTSLPYVITTLPYLTTAPLVIPAPLPSFPRRRESTNENVEVTPL